MGEPGGDCLHGIIDVIRVGGERIICGLGQRACTVAGNGGGNGSLPLCQLQRLQGGLCPAAVADGDCQLSFFIFIAATGMKRISL